MFVCQVVLVAAIVNTQNQNCIYSYLDLDCLINISTPNGPINLTQLIHVFGRYGASNQSSTYTYTRLACVIGIVRSSHLAALFFLMTTLVSGPSHCLQL